MNKKVLVFGSGISGIGACKLLCKEGKQVVLYDGNESLDCEILKQEIGEEGSPEIILGELPMEVMKNLELVVMSPGVPTDLPVVNQMRNMGIPIWGEIELAYTYGQGDVLAITGTNGKTTTTALLGEIIGNYKKSTYVVGNIGNPYTTVAFEMEEDSVAVAEVSSFQLETIHAFSPRISAILNITPDHLNRHHTMEAYIAAKKNIAKNQTEQDTCILNYEDEITRKLGEDLPCKVLYFSSRRKLEKGIYLDNGNIIYKDEKEILICHIDELQLLGIHNYENVMAASAMAYVYGVPLSVIQETVKTFAGVAHRIEFVCEKNGVAYYNDSKGTNPDAAIKGIQAMNRKTVLIGGGYDKDSEYEEWIYSFGGKVKYLVLLGQTKEKIAKAARNCGFNNIILTESLEEAVTVSSKLAKPGEAVLLSPACASWGMFKNYEERGDMFKKFVNAL